LPTVAGCTVGKVSNCCQSSKERFILAPQSPFQTCISNYKQETKMHCLAEIAAAVLPLGGIQAFQGSLIAPLPFLPSPTNPTHKNSNKPFQSWQFPKAVALPNST
jgi:hypothetical protein